MLRLSNIRIGIKLAIAAGCSFIMVAAMMFSQWQSNSHIHKSQEDAHRQSEVVMDALDAKASARGMSMGVKDLRLARDTEQMKAADEFFKARHKSLVAFTEDMIQKSFSTENQARMKLLLAEAKRYSDAQVEMLRIKAQILAAGSEVARLATLNAEFDRAVEVSLAAAQVMNRQAEEIAKFSRQATKSKIDEAAAVMASSERISLGFTLTIMVTLICTAVFGFVSIARPMVSLVAPLNTISQGNFSIAVPNTQRKDEIGQIAQAVERMADKVRATILEVKLSAREVTNASIEISSATTNLSQRTEEQAASLEETSASMEQISATVKKNAENAQQANASAAQTREVADRGGEVVAKAVEAMARIEESSRRISDIITVIDEIARQTNLLALNAAVEAARAGEAGRGFAVVASEVRSLAQRSSQAAKDIKDLITNSNSQVKDGVELVNQAGAALTDIVASIKQVAAVVNDIANASLEQSTGIEQVNKALTQMDEVTQQNSALVEENAATAKTLEHQAKIMDEQVAFFQFEVAAGAESMTDARPITSRPMSEKATARSSEDKPASKPMGAAAPAAPEVETLPIVTLSAPVQRRAAAGGPRHLQATLATAIEEF
jgi:methyl-accepting chemotaxis protein